MTFFDAIILGVVEGFTEFLPISSTGHLILTASLLQLQQTDFLKTFEISIQLGAILSVIILYFRRFFEWETIKRLVVGFIPTGLVGLLLYPLIKDSLIGNQNVVLWSLFLGGIALIAFEYFHGEKDGSSESVSLKQAFLIGLFQAVAIIPGVSRSGATIVGGLALGLSRRTIVEFSFLLAAPTMLAATLYEMYQSAALFSEAQLGLLATGFAVSFVVALISIRFLLRFVRTNTFMPFGIYRIALAALFFVLVVA